VCPRTESQDGAPYSYFMASKSVRVVLLCAALAFALSACQRNDGTQAVSNGQPTQIASEPAQIQVGPTRDPSLPDASAALAAQDAADKARQDALAVQPTATPPSDTPLASQANDVSAPVPDRNRIN
jgi:hypothetical protein